MPAFVPTAITAVESQGLSILYYARPDKYLASLTAQRQGEDPSFPPYTAANVILKGNTVQTTVPQVSAVAYKYQGNDEVRLYYIGGPDNNPYIKELVKSNGGDWSDGALNSNTFRITKDSLLSANVENGSGNLKVFFNGTDDDGNTVPYVAWVVIGQTTWSQRPIGKWK